MLNVLAAVLEVPAGTSVLDDAMKAIIQSGMLDLRATVTDVLAVSVPVIIGVIALTAGVGYAVRKVRSVIFNAQ